MRSAGPRKTGLVQRTAVLIADDNAAVLDVVGKMINKRENYKLVAAMSDGAAVLREYQRLNPDVIILDISMGEVSGIDVARQLRDAGCKAKIVFLTVHADADYVAAAMGAGGLVKSRLILDLLAAIEAVLANKLFVSPNLMYEPG
jgi:DNA-binding NarL/FixJ family response regulator